MCSVSSNDPAESCAKTRAVACNLSRILTPRFVFRSPLSNIYIYIFKDVDSTVIPVRAIVRAIVLARERFVKKEYFLGHGRPASACALCVPRSPSLFEERLPYRSSCSTDLGNFLFAKLEWIVREARRRDEQVPRTVSCEKSETGEKRLVSLLRKFFSSSSSSSSSPSSSSFHYEKSSMNKEYGDFSRGIRIGCM